MKKIGSFKKMTFTAFLILTGLCLISILTGAGRFDKKIAIIATGELSGIFHPFGDDPDNAFLRERLDEVLTRLKKSYPEAIIVDTGNYLSIPDFSETIYNAPALKHFIKHDYDVVNIGSNEIMFEKIIPRSPIASDDAKPHFVSLFKRRSNDKNLVTPFVDIRGASQKPARFLGISLLSHEYSAPHLNDAFHSLQLSDALKTPPSAGLNILLSDIPHAENLRIAESVSGVDVIFESCRSLELPVYREKGVFFCRRSELESVGLYQLKRDAIGKIEKISFKSYPLTEKKGFLGLFRQRIDREIKNPLPIIGMTPKEQSYFKKLSARYDTKEVHRTPIGAFSPWASNSQVYFYELYQKREFIGRSLLIEHSLGKGRPYYLFFITFKPDNACERIDFVAPPSFLFWQMEVEGFAKRYYGKNWNEMSFDPQGCLGAIAEFKALHDDIRIAAQIIDSLSPINND